MANTPEGRWSAGASEEGCQKTMTTSVRSKFEVAGTPVATRGIYSHGRMIDILYSINNGTETFSPRKRENESIHKVEQSGMV